MAEYIERESAIAWFMPYVHAGESIDADVVISDIKGMKSADVAEVVHGKWVDNGIPDSILSGCSVCGFTCGSSSFFYCPICGAKMDESDESEN